MEINKDELALNAKLQQKKHKLRLALREKGILKKGSENTFDRYKYFSEAQYKSLFTELFTDAGLELAFDYCILVVTSQKSRYFPQSEHTPLLSVLPNILDRIISRRGIGE